jgi:DNA-binding transcriptional LysR family regulator
MGIALLSRDFVADDLAHGRLVAVLRDFVINGGPRDVAILYSGRNYLSMKVRSFVDFVVNEYRSSEKQLALRAVA